MLISTPDAPFYRRDRRWDIAWLLAPAAPLVLSAGGSVVIGRAKAKQLKDAGRPDS